MHMPTRSRPPGFTLIELLAVVTLMSVAVGMLVFRMDGLTDRGSLQSAATQLSSLVRLAQTQARTDGSPRLIEYLVDSDRAVIRAPKEENGGWHWSHDTEYLTNTGTRIEDVVVEGTIPTAMDDNDYVIRIRADGRFRAHAVILRRHELYAVTILQATEKPRLAIVQKRPQTASFELLMLELESAHGPG